jgi:DUF971 family protein
MIRVSRILSSLQNQTNFAVAPNLTDRHEKTIYRHNFLTLSSITESSPGNRNINLHYRPSTSPQL